MAYITLAHCNFASHITDIPAENKYLTYQELIATVANDPYYDTCMVGLHLTWFSVTLFQGSLTTMSTYPRNGESGESYKRVSVPISRFSYYKVWCCDGESNNQERLILTNRRVHEIMLGNAEGFELIDMTEPNSFLVLHGKQQWYITDHAAEQSWVSHAVFLGTLMFQMVTGIQWRDLMLVVAISWTMTVIC